MLKKYFTLKNILKHETNLIKDSCLKDTKNLQTQQQENEQLN